MIRRPKPGQSVQLWYAAGKRPSAPHHGVVGEVLAVSGGPGPRNHLVAVHGRPVVVPAGNLRVPLPEGWAALEAEAERLWRAAIAAANPATGYPTDKSDRLARRAVRALAEAARIAPPKGRAALYVLAVERAGVAEDQDMARRLIVEACRLDGLDHEQVEALREHWEWCCWDDRPFPEPPPPGSRTALDRRGPVDGQMAFDWEAP